MEYDLKDKDIICKVLCDGAAVTDNNETDDSGEGVEDQNYLNHLWSEERERKIWPLQSSSLIVQRAHCLRPTYQKKTAKEIFLSEI